MLQTNDYLIVCNRNVVAGGTKVCGFRLHCWSRYPLYYNCLGPVKTGHRCDMLDLWLILNDERCRYMTLSNVQRFASLVLFVVRASTGNLISGKCVILAVSKFLRFLSERSSFSWFLSLCYFSPLLLFTRFWSDWIISYQNRSNYQKLIT